MVTRSENCKQVNEVQLAQVAGVCGSVVLPLGLQLTNELSNSGSFALRFALPPERVNTGALHLSTSRQGEGRAGVASPPHV